MRGTFENTRRLARLILRRERVMSAVWIIMLVFVSVIVLPVLQEGFGTEFDLLMMAETMKNPAMIALLGPIYGAERYTVASMYANEMLLLTIITVAIMNIFFVIRHTRADEEKGRVEVIRSLPTGRLSNLNATLIIAVLINIAVALFCGIGIYLTGVDGVSFQGAMLYGAALGASGICFAAVAALFSQISVSARGAAGYSFLFMGVCYILRAAGDINSETLSRISPLGLILRAQVFVENYWWPVIAVLLISAAFMAAAFYLNFIRDMGQGFIPARPGRKSASAMLQSPLGLSFRLLRNTLFGWAFGLFALGAVYGSVMNEIEMFVAQNEFFQQVIRVAPGESTAELFLGMLNIIMAICSAVPVLIAALKLRNEEKMLHTEHILGRAVSRVRYMAGYLIIAAVTSVVVPVVSIAGLWSACAATMEAPPAFGAMLGSMLLYLPALWVTLGVAVLLTGALPALSGVSWAYLGFSFFVVYIGRMANLPEWVQKLTPFSYIPEGAREAVNYGALAMMTCIAAALTAAGVYFYQRRDMVNT
jgi:ABC-2 type transport system permease protein